MFTETTTFVVAKPIVSNIGKHKSNTFVIKVIWYIFQVFSYEHGWRLYEEPHIWIFVRSIVLKNEKQMKAN